MGTKGAFDVRSRILAMILMIACGLGLKPQAASAASSGSSYSTTDVFGTILVSGLVGGVLGLSTLSFCDRPQDNLRNVFWGVGLGVIVAAVYETVMLASNPKSFGENQTPDGGVPSLIASDPARANSLLLAPRVEPMIGNGYFGFQLTKNF